MNANIQTASDPAVACTSWLDAPPPKDGTAIVAVGRIIWEDEFSIGATQFVSAICWRKSASSYEGWHYYHDGMTVARTPEDKVMVDWWLPLPSNDRAERRRDEPER